jgi:hypothetical protein
VDTKRFLKKRSRWWEKGKRFPSKENVSMQKPWQKGLADWRNSKKATIASRKREREREN